MQKVELFCTAEIIASVPFDITLLLFVFLSISMNVETPADVKVSDNKKIKVT